MVVWTNKAISHIEEFINNAREDTEETARNYMNKLTDYVEELEDMPENLIIKDDKDLLIKLQKGKKDADVDIFNQYTSRIFLAFSSVILSFITAQLMR